MSQDGKDNLLLAMTRPAVVAGLPLGALAACMSAGMLTWALTNALLWGLVVAVPMYLASRVIVMYDINAFNLLALWLKCRYANNVFANNRKLWGGTSFSPTANHHAKRKGFGRVEISD